MNKSTETITATIARKLAAKRENQIRRAIRETDWSKAAVLRIVVRQPPPFEPGPSMPDIESYRYKDRAPPVRDHADGKHRFEIMTVTKPLLESLSEEYPQVKEVL